MALMQPVVVGPLSELSSSVRVRGQLPGATVTVEAAGPAPRTVAKDVATSGDQRFQLLPGASLDRHDRIYAVQHLGGQQSDVPSGDQAQAVAPRPASGAELGAVRIVTHPYACGRFVWIDGGVPGADITLLAAGVTLGSGKANEGTARFGLGTAIPLDSFVTAHQSVPGLGPGPDISRPADPIPGHSGQRLPPPVLEPPLRDCDASVQVTGVIDGASVTLERRSGTVETAGFDRSALRLILSRPLDEDDELTTWQAVDERCERPPAHSNPVTVGKLQPVDAPQVTSPLCAGGTLVRVTGLRPGAIVHLAANQRVYGGATPPDQTWLDCRVPPLTTDPVGATQELCGVTSPPSEPVTVDPHEDNVPAAQILGPLFSCTGSVSVTRAHRGAMLQIFVRTFLGDAPISDQVLSRFTNLVIGVSPLLREGSAVFVRQWACSDTSTDSAAETIVAHPGPGPVQVLRRLFESDVVATVRGAIAGASVEVFARGRAGAPPEFLGANEADRLHAVTAVHLHRPLLVEDQIYAQQRICDGTSDPQDSIIVERQVGFGPRPFYVVGHNPNTAGDGKNAVNDGANGLEPDVQVYEDRSDLLCINHGTGDPSAPSLVAYLDAVAPDRRG